ncbi:hypothetical protein, partial [Dysosmobacter sp.]|uniref:hypothetical protein n=1 Tax=Dysosmobacter sp. TaxID=2591382 RepID=UPI002A8B88A1
AALRLFPPFSLLVQRKVAAGAVEKKHGLWSFGYDERPDQGSPQTLPTRPGSLLPSALYIE